MFYSVTLIVFVLDLILKFIVTKLLEPVQTVPLIRNVLHITYVQNYGSAFGFFRDQRIFLIMVGVIICSVVIYMYSRSSKKDRPIDISFGLILGGSFGNLLNRVVLGYVIDYIDFRFFPVFNLADVAINIGVAIIIFEMVFRGRECIR